jgi:hypothetical protein
METGILPVTFAMQKTLNILYYNTGKYTISYATSNSILIEWIFMVRKYSVLF